MSPVKSTKMRTFNGTGFFDTIQPATPKRTHQNPHSPLEMPDLEGIIREFETGFLSPTKHDNPADSSGQKNFVKKIVAAFEVKYNAYNDQKREQETRQIEDNREQQEDHGARIYCSTFAETPKRRSGIFGSPFKFAQGDQRNAEQSDDYGNSRTIVEESGRRTGFFSTPSGERKSGIIPTPFSIAQTLEKERQRRSGIYMNPVLLDREESPISSPLFLERVESGFSSPSTSTIFKFDEDAPRNRRSNQFPSSFKVSPLDDTQNIDSIDLDMSSPLPVPEETILLDANELEQKMDDCSRNEINLEELAHTVRPDRAPKIVGAFLKKPIEVEDTSIDWIPVMGKKLPRKRSLKKLLSTLKRKKSFEKKSKTLYPSEKTNSDDSKELQDSGYDEKSCSSSSLTSLISISEALLQQGNSYVRPERRSTLKTFRSKSSLDEDEDEAFYENCSNVQEKKPKLLLTEVPRKDVKLDLGPSYPTPSFPSKMVTMSLDRRTTSKPKTRSQSPRCTTLTKIPKHPCLSKIPKHPYVSVTKMDNLEEQHETPEIECRSVKNDLYEVEFRRSSSGFQSANSYRTSSSSGSEYDVPRRYLSKSESGIPEALKSMEGRRRNEPVYDVPKSRVPVRPRSSVYEDALSLKRRTAHLTVSTAPDFYAFANDEEPHYATIKPRNRRICFSEEMMKSTGDLSIIAKNHSF